MTQPHITPIYVLCLLSLLSACGSSDSGSAGPNFNAREYGGVVNGFNAVRSVRYDELGAVVGSTTYDHDPMSRTRTWTDFDASGAIAWHDVCKFNEYGRETSCDSFDSFQTHLYTDTYSIENGLLTGRQRTRQGSDELQEVVEFNYEGNRLTSRVYSSIEDSGAITETRRVTYTYAADGRPDSKTESFGSPEEFTYTFEYNDAGQLSDIIEIAADGSPINVETWRYDENGNIDRRTINWVDGPYDWVTTDYEYEASPFTVTNHLIRIMKYWL